MREENVIAIESLIRRIEIVLNQHGLELNKVLDKRVLRTCCRLIFGIQFHSAEEKLARQKIRFAEVDKLQPKIKRLMETYSDLEAYLKSCLPEEVGETFRFTGLSFESSVPVHIVDPKQSMIFKIEKNTDLSSLGNQIQRSGSHLDREYFDAINMQGITNNFFRAFVAVVGLATLAVNPTHTDSKRPLVTIGKGSVILTEIWESFLSDCPKQAVLMEMSEFFQGLADPEPQDSEGAAFKRLMGKIQKYCHSAIDDEHTARRFFHFDIVEPDLWLTAMSLIKNPKFIQIWKRYSHLAELGFGSSEI